MDETLEHNGRESWYSFIQVVGKATATWTLVPICDEARDHQWTRKSVVARPFVRNPTRASVARSARKRARRNKGEEDEEEEERCWRWRKLRTGRTAMVSAVARDRHPKFWNLKLPRMPLTRRAPRPWLPRSLFFLACVRFWRHLRRSGRRLLALSSRRPNQVRASFSLPKLSSAQQRQPGGTRSYGSPPLRPNVAATKEEEDANSRGDWCRKAGGGCVDSWFRIPSWRLPAKTCLESALASRVSSGVEEEEDDVVGTTRSDGFQGAEPDQRHGYRAKGRKEKLFASRAQWKG